MPQPTQQRHTESTILQSYLLPPSPLPTILPYTSFLQLVPTQHRNNPDLKRLYRDLQFQRTIDIDTVRRNIDREVSRGIVLKAQLARRVDAELLSSADGSRSKKRKRDRDHDKENEAHDGSVDGSGSDNEFTDETNVAIDTTYLTASIHPSHANGSSTHPLTSATSKHHNTASLLTALDSACSSLEGEVSELEAESSGLLAEINEIVGSMSDLRYGKFARTVSGIDGEERTVEDEVLEALKGLQSKLEGAFG